MRCFEVDGVNLYISVTVPCFIYSSSSQLMDIFFTLLLYPATSLFDLIKVIRVERITGFLLPSDGYGGGSLSLKQSRVTGCSLEACCVRFLRAFKLISAQSVNRKAGKSHLFSCTRRHCIFQNANICMSWFRSDFRASIHHLSKYCDLCRIGRSQWAHN